MIALEITAPGKPRLVEADVPAIAPDEVLIRVERSGICGTDIHILHGTYQAHYPLIPGHEFAGTVSAVGGEVRGFAVGDRVTADPNLACGYCRHCQRNQPNQCLEWAGLGVTRPGGFAEFVAVPQSNVYPIGDLPFAEAAFIEPLACVVWGVHVLRPRVGDQALIFGAGPMGCLVMQNLKAAGVTEVTIVDKLERRLALARELGADHALHPDEVDGPAMGRIAPGGFDIVTDATGVPAVVEQCFAHARGRGKVWLFGVCPPDATVRFSPFEAFRKDLSIYGTYAVNRTFHESIALITSGAVRVGPLLSHSLPLSAAEEGLRIAEHDPDRMKVQFVL